MGEEAAGQREGWRAQVMGASGLGACSSNGNSPGRVKSLQIIVGAGSENQYNGKGSL